MGTIVPSAPGESPFDALRQVREDGSEIWFARELQGPAGYTRWQRFADVIERAKVSAKNTGHDVNTAFVQVTKVTNAGKLGDLEYTDYELSRHACYLVFMNGDPRKPEIAAAQTYFAVKAREAEIAANLGRTQNVSTPGLRPVLLIEPGRDETEVWAWSREGENVRFLHAMPHPAIERAARELRHDAA